VEVGGTGLYYYRFRDYSADLGRFLQTDPTGTIDGTTMDVFSAL
jgi:RHS repeat-associated protein